MIKKICIFFPIVLIICSFHFSSSAENKESNYDLGYVKGSFLIETGYSIDDAELQTVLSDLPSHRICYVDALGAYYLSLDDPNDHDRSYEILKNAAGVLDVSLDLLPDDDPSKAFQRKFAIFIETKYKWFDPELDAVRTLFSSCKVIKLESDIVNFYFIDVNAGMSQSEKNRNLYNELEKYPDILTVKVNNGAVNVSSASGDSDFAGDIDGDKEITITDYLMMKYIILGSRRFQVWQRQNADINGDGDIDITDILILKRHILGIRTIFPQYTVSDVGGMHFTNLFCCLFGHNCESEIVTVITHNVRQNQPKCLETVMNVHSCTRCGHTSSEIISKSYIYCEE
ncbi:MAG: dockerin type I repeat-containing protein [Clostridia bacterium]|nr:dockerin type I repeat-containing protein [Clostridia bacterium]